MRREEGRKRASRRLSRTSQSFLFVTRICVRFTQISLKLCKWAFFCRSENPHCVLYSLVDSLWNQFLLGEVRFGKTLPCSHYRSRYALGPIQYNTLTLPFILMLIANTPCVVVNIVTIKKTIISKNHSWSRGMTKSIESLNMIMRIQHDSLIYSSSFQVSHVTTE